jgi:hypothetical protein
MQSTKTKLNVEEWNKELQAWERGCCKTDCKFLRINMDNKING